VLIYGRHNLDRGRDCLRQAYELAASTGSIFGCIGALNNLAGAALEAGDAAEAGDVAERGLKLIANELTQPTGVPFEFDSYFDLIGQLGCAKVHLGNSAEGIASLTTALDGHLRISDEYIAAEDLLRLAWALAPTEPTSAARLYAVQDAIGKRLELRLEPHATSIRDQLLATLRYHHVPLQQIRVEAAAAADHPDALAVMRHAAQEAGLLREGRQLRGTSDDIVTR
jgi:hypothetical protein